MWSEKGKSALNVFIIIAKKAIFPPFLFNRQILKIRLKIVKSEKEKRCSNVIKRKISRNGKATEIFSAYRNYTYTVVVSSVYCTTIWGFKSFTS